MKFNLQVKSSQVKSCSNFDGGRARRLWGARRRDRSGGRGAAQLAWLESPEPGLYRLSTSSSRFLLDHRGGAPGHHLRAFFRMSSLWRCKTDPGQRRQRSGACAPGLFRWATVLVPSRVWSTASAARREHARPASDEFGRLWPDKGPSIVLGHAKEAGATAARAVEGVSECATHTPPAHHACARARDTGAATRTSWCRARMRAAAQQSRGRGGRCTRPRVTMGTRPRTTRTSRFLDAARGAAGGRQRLDRRHQEEEAEEEGEGRKVSATTARCSTTGLSPRGMRVRYIVR